MTDPLDGHGQDPSDVPDHGHDGPAGHAGSAHEHHTIAEIVEAAPPGTGAAGDATTEQLMAQAIGGWRGLVDSSLPSVVFLVVYLVDGQSLTPAIWGAVGAAALIAAVRLARRESVQQVISGLVGVAFAAWLASRTGRAEDYYLPGLIWNAGEALVLAVSVVVGHPLLGYGVGAATGDLTGWRRVPEQRRAYALATWFFVGVFALRIAVQLPLYLAAAVGPLGVARLVMGWPLQILAIYLAYRVIRTARAEAPVPEIDVEEPGVGSVEPG